MLHVFAKKLGRYVNTNRRFLRDPSPMKKRFNCGTFKTVTATDLRNSIRKTRRNEKSHIHPSWTSSCTENHQKSHRSGPCLPCEFPWNCLLLCPTKEIWGFNGLGSTWCWTRVVFCSLTIPEQLLTDLEVGRIVGPILKMSVTNVYSINIRVDGHVLGWYHWRQTY